MAIGREGAGRPRMRRVAGSEAVRGRSEAVRGGSEAVRGRSEAVDRGPEALDRRDVVILGSTGSIGTQALDVVRRNPGRFRVVGIAAGGADVGALAAQALEFDVPVVGVARSSAAADLQAALRTLAGTAATDGELPQVLAGPDAATEVAGLPADVVLNGMTGSIGLRPTLAALATGAVLALANKESLVVGGPLVAGGGRARPDRAGRLRALRARPVPAIRLGGARCGGWCSRPAAARSAAGPATQLAARHPRRGAGPPHLGHGPGRDDELRDAGQQGSRGDRGPPALRHPVRPDRRRRAPAVGGALHGRVRRRLDPRPGQPAGHAAADRARALLARPRRRTPRPGATGRRRPPGSSPRSTTPPSPPSAWPASPAPPAAPRRRSTTPPTRSASRPSTPGPCPSWASSTRSHACSTSTSPAGTACPDRPTSGTG